MLGTLADPAAALVALDQLSATDALARFGVAAAAGLLVGMQRQYAGQVGARSTPDTTGGGSALSDEPSGADQFAGARTFTLVGALGGLAAVLADEYDSAALAVAGLAAVTLLAAAGYWIVSRRGDVGLTTELAMLVTYAAGLLAGDGEFQLAGAVAVGTTALLALKPYTRAFVAKIDERDVTATLQLAVLAALVLPILPRDPIGDAPFDAASPFKVGLMVVFILGLSFLGYVSIKVAGTRRGIGLTGLLGGLVSSTAVTLAMSERSKHSAGLLRPLTMAVLAAWSIMFGRVLVEIGVVNPSLLTTAAAPIAIGALLTAGWAGWLLVRRRERDGDGDAGEFANPFSIGPAVKFGLLYGAVLIGSKALSMYLGDAGVYAGAVVSGIADVDAITLSMAELSRDGGEISDTTATRAIVLAAASNTAVKTGLIWVTAAPTMRRLVVPGAVAAVVVPLAVAFVR